MKNDNKKRLKALYTVLLIAAVILGATYLANSISESKYQQALSRLNKLLSQAGFSLGKE